MSFKPIIDGLVYFRSGKKWKQCYCALSRQSKVCDSLQLHFFKDDLEFQRRINEPLNSTEPEDSRVSIIPPTENVYGFIDGLHMDNRRWVTRLICDSSVHCLAFQDMVQMNDWGALLRKNLLDAWFHVRLVAVDRRSRLQPGQEGYLHVQQHRICFVSDPESSGRARSIAGSLSFAGGNNAKDYQSTQPAVSASKKSLSQPPKLLLSWPMDQLVAYGSPDPLSDELILESGPSTTPVSTNSSQHHAAFSSASGTSDGASWGRFCMEGSELCKKGCGLFTFQCQQADQLNTAVVDAINKRLPEYIGSKNNNSPSHNNNYIRSYSRSYSRTLDSKSGVTTPDKPDTVTHRFFPSSTNNNMSRGNPYVAEDQHKMPPGAPARQPLPRTPLQSVGSTTSSHQYEQLMERTRNNTGEGLEEMSESENKPDNKRASASPHDYVQMHHSSDLLDSLGLSPPSPTPPPVPLARSDPTPLSSTASTPRFLSTFRKKSKHSSPNNSKSEKGTPKSDKKSKLEKKQRKLANGPLCQQFLHPADGVFINDENDIMEIKASQSKTLLDHLLTFKRKPKTSGTKQPVIKEDSPTSPTKTSFFRSHSLNAKRTREKKSSIYEPNSQEKAEVEPKFWRRPSQNIDGEPHLTSIKTSNPPAHRSATTGSYMSRSNNFNPLYTPNIYTSSRSATPVSVFHLDPPPARPPKNISYDPTSNIPPTQNSRSINNSRPKDGNETDDDVFDCKDGGYQMDSYRRKGVVNGQRPSMETAGSNLGYMDMSLTGSNGIPTGRSPTHSSSSNKQPPSILRSRSVTPESPASHLHPPVFPPQLLNNDPASTSVPMNGGSVEIRDTYGTLTGPHGPGRLSTIREKRLSSDTASPAQLPRKELTQSHTAPISFSVSIPSSNMPSSSSSVQMTPHNDNLLSSSSLPKSRSHPPQSPRRHNPIPHSHTAPTIDTVSEEPMVDLSWHYFDESDSAVVDEEDNSPIDSSKVRFSVDLDAISKEDYALVGGDVWQPKKEANAETQRQDSVSSKENWNQGDNFYASDYEEFDFARRRTVSERAARSMDFSADDNAPGKQMCVNCTHNISQPFTCLYEKSTINPSTGLAGEKPSGQCQHAFCHQMLFPVPITPLPLSDDPLLSLQDSPNALVRALPNTKPRSGAEYVDKRRLLRLGTLARSAGEAEFRRQFSSDNGMGLILAGSIPYEDIPLVPTHRERQQSCQPGLAMYAKPPPPENDGHYSDIFSNEGRTYMNWPHRPPSAMIPRDSRQRSHSPPSVPETSSPTQNTYVNLPANQLSIPPFQHISQSEAGSDPCQPMEVLDPSRNYSPVDLRPPSLHLRIESGSNLPFGPSSHSSNSQGEASPNSAQLRYAVLDIVTPPPRSQHGPVLRNASISHKTPETPDHQSNYAVIDFQHTQALFELENEHRASTPVQRPVQDIMTSSVNSYDVTGSTPSLNKKKSKSFKNGPFSRAK